MMIRSDWVCSNVVLKMTLKFSAVSTIAFAVLLTGCYTNHGVTQEIEKWENLGWEFVETIGASRPDAVYMSHVTSSSASSVKASSHTNEQGHYSKTYQQKSQQFLIVSMGHEAHGNFSLVFSKPKS